MKKKAVKIISVTLCAALTLALAGTTASARADGLQMSSESSRFRSNDVETEENVSLETNTSPGETVYVLAGADGSVKKIIVNQETIEKELPVQMKVSYTLDGTTISPEELAGKSGHVTIHFDYQNQQYEEVLIDGKKEKIYVPFTMVTGLLLDTERFHNVEVSNGKLVSDGERLIVMGIAFPGLQESLDLDRDKLELPDSVEISADVENFAMEMTLTLATTELFASVDSEKIDIHELSDSLADLTEAVGQLMDGSSQLYDGLSTLLEKSDELVKGIDQLADGGEALNEGASALDDGASQLKSGAETLADGLETLADNNSSLNGGAEQVFESLLSMANTQLAEAGLSVSGLTIDNYAEVLDGVIVSLDDTAVYQAAEAQGKSQGEANRSRIEAQVTEAVQAQVEAEVSAQVTAGVADMVSQAVRDNESQFRAAVVQQALSLTLEEYETAVGAGLIGEEQQAAINEAVEAAMQADIDARMQSDEVQAQIITTVRAYTEEQLQSTEIQALIAENTGLQVQQAISAAMSSDEVQAQLRAAAEGAQSVIALKASLDSYHAFYLGLRSYTSGVSQAAQGAAELKNGVDSLKEGTSELSGGAGALFDGIQTMQDSAPSLIDGITQLRDGSQELSEGLQQFNEEGIQKLVDAVDGDLEGLARRMRLLADAAEHYISFTGACEGVNGEVKFIYKTDAIE